MLTACLAACSPPPTGTPATPQQIEESIRSATAPLTLVHVWATWCDPCRKEFPELLEAYRETRKSGLQLLLVSADNPNTDLDKVNQFLQEQQSPVGSLVSTELNQEFIEMFSTNWTGALPASFFFDANGTLVAEWQGKRSAQEYIDTITPLLSP